MSQQDREKWNRKYTERTELLTSRPPSRLLEKYADRSPGKDALDLACGSGRNALYLSEKGFTVDAVDISAIALKHLALSADEKITIIEADLDSFSPPKEAYDLIIKTNYLDRAMIERATTSLKPGGIFVIETYMNDPKNEKKDSNPKFFLDKEELPRFFTEGYQILEYREFWNEAHETFRMKKQSIVVQKRDQ